MSKEIISYFIRTRRKYYDNGVKTPISQIPGGGLSVIPVDPMLTGEFEAMRDYSGVTPGVRITHPIAV